MISFLFPAFLAGAAAVAIPIVLHLLKREPEPRVKFPAVRLLKHAPVELTQRRRLRELILLTLRVAALTLLALAFARPFFPSGAAVGAAGTTIVALDTSYSLSAPGRMARARQLAREAIDRAPTGDLVGVVAFSDVADVVARPSADRALASAAIDRVQVGFGATRYRAGLATAARLVAGRRSTIVVVTDLQESGWDAGDRAVVPESARVDVADVGAPPPDLAVTALRVGADRIVATIRNTDTKPRETHARLTIDSRPAGDIAVTIGPQSAADAIFPQGSGASAQVTVDDRDGLQADNVRYAVIETASRPAVAVVTSTGDVGRDAFYLQQAVLASADGRAAYAVNGVSGSQLSGWDDARFNDHAAFIVVSTRGLERKAREAIAAYVRRGGGVLVAAGPDVDGEVVADLLGAGAALKIASADVKPEPRTLAPADVRHPLFRPFGVNAGTLGLVKFRHAARVGGADCQALARFTTGEAALVECGAGEGRALVVASDLNNQWNDFPLRQTFVPFVHETIRYLTSGRVHADEYIVGDAPAGVPQTPGIATLGDGSAPRRRIAVNVDPREIDPARISAAEFVAAVTKLKELAATDARIDAVQQEDRQRLWQYALVAMFAFVAVEGLVASRTA